MSVISGFYNYLVGSKPPLTRRNVASDWKESQGWRSWIPPLDIVRGEPQTQDALTKLAGPARKHGYLIPVAVTLRRQPSNASDRHAIRVQINSYSVGYIASDFAEYISRLLEKSGFPLLLVAGLIRGGSSLDPALQIHLWPSHRLSPGPNLKLKEAEKFQSPWPPANVEGEHTEATG